MTNIQGKVSYDPIRSYTTDDFLTSRQDFISFYSKFHPNDIFFVVQPLKSILHQDFFIHHTSSYSSQICSTHGFGEHSVMIISELGSVF